MEASEGSYMGSLDEDESWSYGREAPPPAPALGPRVLLASLTINLLSLGLPLVILQVYDRILPNNATETLLMLVLGLCVVLLIDAALRLSRSYVTGWNAASFEHATSCRAVDRLLSTPIDRFESESAGIHLDRLNAVDLMRDHHAGQGRLMLVDLPFIALFLVLIWTIAGSLVLVPLALLILLASAALLVGHFLKQALEERAQLDDRRYSFIIEVLSGMQTVKGLAMEPLLQRRYERLQESGAVNTFRCTFLSNLAQGIGSSFSNLTMVGVAAFGSTYVIAGELSIGGLAACTLLSGRAVQPLLRALGIWTQFQNIRVARERLQSLFAFRPEAEDEKPPIHPLRGAIELRDLTFGYEGEDPPLIEGINLSVEPGEVVGITGGTGSGKSTLLMLMMGVLQPTSGQVLYDGVDLADCDPLSARHQIGYLPQRTALFQGTILDNVTTFRGPGSTQGALEATRLLGLDRAIHRLPAGYETKVGDGSDDELPAGLKQGIAMSRALASNPRVILFDEANSALDSTGDAKLKEALASMKGQVTMILVSHRPSLLALADRVFHLQAGMLVPKHGETESFAPPPTRTTGLAPNGDAGGAGLPALKLDLASA